MARMRKNITVSVEIAKWYEQESKRLGISQASLIALTMQQYIDQRQALDMTDTLKRLIDIVGSQGELTAEQKLLLKGE